MPFLTALGQHLNISTRPVDWVPLLLSKETIRAILRLIELAANLLGRLQRSQAPYEALKLDFLLELVDKEGRQALYQKKELVRFLRECSAFYDEAWYDGVSLRSRVRPGRIIDRRRVGSHYRSLVALPATKRKGEVLPFTIRRVIRNGFRRSEECWFEAEISHRVRNLSVAVLFPRARRVRSAEVVTQLTQTTTPLAPDVLRDGRQLVMYSVAKPSMGRHTVQWKW